MSRDKRKAVIRTLQRLAVALAVVDAGARYDALAALLERGRAYAER